MSLIGVLGSLGAGGEVGPFYRVRTAVGVTVSGRYTPGSTSTVQLSSNTSVQPQTGEQLKVAPEGRHADELKAVYTTTDLRARPVPDLVTIGGEQYEVYLVERWPAFGATHYEALVSKLVQP